MSKIHLKNTGTNISPAEKSRIVAKLKKKYEEKGFCFPDHDRYYCSICKTTGKVDFRGKNMGVHLRTSRHQNVLNKQKEIVANEKAKKNLMQFFD